MRKSTVSLLACLLLILSMNVAFGAVTTFGNATRCSATADTIAVPTERFYVAISIIPSATSKYYRIRNATSTGNILWEWISPSSGTDVKYIDTIPLKAPGGSTLYIHTDDTTPTMILYQGVGIN